MNSKLLLIMNRLKLINPQLNLSPPSRSYFTGNKSKVNLYSRLIPLGDPSINLVPELDQWVQERRKVHYPDVKHIIRDLRKRKRFTQALQVSEWLDNKGVYSLTSSDHAVRLDLIGRVRGLDSAESYFSSMSSKHKTVKTYGALLNCYVKACQTEKALSHLQKMKELGFASSPLCYNDLMCLYTNTGEYEKVPNVLKEMKESGISPDNFSYRICINSYGEKSNIREMDKVLEEMENQPHVSMECVTYTTVANYYIKAGLIEKAVATLKKAEEKLNKNAGLDHNYLITLYATLGNKTEVMRLWELKKVDLKHKCNNLDYITMLGSLVKLEELEEAEELFKEWESSAINYDFRVPNVLLIAYSKRDMVEKAETLLKDISEKRPLPVSTSWGLVAAGYAAKDEMEKAGKCMKKAFAYSANSGGWKPNPKVISRILWWFGEKGDVEEVEAFVESLKAFSPMNKNMYNALIKANVRAGKDVDGHLESMKANNIDADEETEKILSLKQY